MKKYRFINPLLAGLSLLFFVGCTSNEVVVAPDDFTVTVASIPGYSFRKDNTSAGVDTILIHQKDVVNFQFSKSVVVDQILFYSGEAGNEYRYRNRYLADTADYKKTFGGSFKSTISIVTALNSFNATKSYNLSLQATDSISTYTKEGLNAAVWTVLKPALRTKLDGTNETATLDLPFDWLMKNQVQPAIVFKTTNMAVNQPVLPFTTNVFTIQNIETRDYSVLGYVGTQQTVTYKVIDNFDQAFWAQCNPDLTDGVLNNQDYQFNVGELGKTGRSAIDSLNYNSTGRKITLTYPITLFPPINAAKAVLLAASVPSESWLLPRKYSPRQVFPDVPTTYVKTKSMNAVFGTSRTYSNLGVYKVAIVAMNTGVSDSKSVVREMVVIVQ